MRLMSIVILALAVALGAVAVLGVRSLITNQQVAAPVAQEVVASSVVVAREPLEFGTELTPELLREIPWASTERPEGSFASIDEIIGTERRVALRSIAPGELILKDRISGFGGRATLSQIINPGMRAMTLRINDVTGAAGFILPGDRVDVLFTSQPGLRPLDQINNILLEDVRVLAIDQIASESSEGAVVAKAATLEVVPEDAQKIALASTIGSLSLSLRTLADALEVAEGEEDGKDALKTIRYSDLGPDKPKEEVRRAVVTPFASMQVTRGLDRSRASVIRERAPAPQPETSGAPQSSNDRGAANDDTSLASATKLTAPAGE